MQASTLPLLSVSQLTKVFRQGFRLGPVSFQMAAGETIAFIGANGAGKSTLFQMLSGNSDPSSGEILVLGKKLRPENYQLKRQIGYLPQNLPLPRWVTGLEILRYAANLYELPKPSNLIDEAMTYWDCHAFAKKPLAACSHGMQKRVALALATLHNPPCLILDEPFSGLDLYHTRALELAITKRQEAGKSTILSTHIAPYAAKLCQRVFISKAGQVSYLEGWTTKDRTERIQCIESCFFTA